MSRFGSELFSSRRHWSNGESFDNSSFRQNNQVILLSKDSLYIPLPVLMHPSPVVNLRSSYARNSNLWTTANILSNHRYDSLLGTSGNTEYILSNYTCLFPSSDFSEFLPLYMMVLLKEYYEQIHAEWLTYDADRKSEFVENNTHMFEFWINKNLIRGTDGQTKFLKREVVRHISNQNIRIVYKTTAEFLEGITPYAMPSFSTPRQMKETKFNIGIASLSLL